MGRVAWWRRSHSIVWGMRSDVCISLRCSRVGYLFHGKGRKEFDTIAFVRPLLDLYIYVCAVCKSN